MPKNQPTTKQLHLTCLNPPTCLTIIVINRTKTTTSSAILRTRPWESSTDSSSSWARCACQPPKTRIWQQRKFYLRHPPRKGDGSRKTKWCPVQHCHRWFNIRTSKVQQARRWLDFHAQWKLSNVTAWTTSIGKQPRMPLGVAGTQPSRRRPSRLRKCCERKINNTTTVDMKCAETTPNCPKPSLSSTCAIVSNIGRSARSRTITRGSCCNCIPTLTTL